MCVCVFVYFWPPFDLRGKIYLEVNKCRPSQWSILEKSSSCLREQGFGVSQEASHVCDSCFLLQDAFSGKLNGTCWTASAPPLFMTSHPSSVCSSYHIQQPLLLASVSFCRLMLLSLEYRHTHKCSDETLGKPRSRWEVNIIMDPNDKNRSYNALLWAH